MKSLSTLLLPILLPLLLILTHLTLALHPRARPLTQIPPIQTPPLASSPYHQTSPSSKSSTFSNRNRTNKPKTLAMKRQVVKRAKRLTDCQVVAICIVGVGGTVGAAIMGFVLWKSRV